MSITNEPTVCVFIPPCSTPNMILNHTATKPQKHNWSPSPAGIKPNYKDQLLHKRSHRKDLQNIKMVKGREKQTAHSSFMSSTISSPLEAKTITTSLPNVKAEPNSQSLDDSTVELEDAELKESVHLKKFYRQIQRQVHCREQEKV